MNYFIAPRSGEKSYKNFTSTIIHGVPYERIADHLSPEGREKVLGEQVIYAWGNRAGTAAQWERMQEGDIVVFYAKGVLVMYGTVYFKQASAALAEAMWPLDENNKPWEYTFFLNNLRYIKLPMKAFNSIAGYKSNFIVQGFLHLRGEHLAQIENQYGTLETLLETFTTETSAEMPKSTAKLYVNVDEEIEPIIRTKLFIHPKQMGSTRAQNPAKKVDHQKRSRTNALTGSKGEALVVRAEQRRLERAGKYDLAKKVKRVSIDDDTLGYDVHSYEEDGASRYIEVKSSSQVSEGIRFYMSSNEMKKSKITPNYYIYYVDGVNSQKPRITPIKYPFDQKFLITTDTYLLQAEIN